MGEAVTGAVTNLMGVVTTVIDYVTDNAVLAVCFVAGNGCSCWYCYFQQT